MPNATTSKFLKVRCTDCGNEQVIFGKPSTEVLCNVCGTPLASPTGGLGNVTAELIEELE